MFSTEYTIHSHKQDPGYAKAHLFHQVMLAPNSMQLPVTLKFHVWTLSGQIMDSRVLAHTHTHTLLYKATDLKFNISTII